MQGGTISSAIHALALAARSMSRPSPTTGSLTRGNGRGVTDFWPAASGAAPEAQYIPKRGGFWGVRHCRGQRTHRPRQSPVRMRGWGGVWLGRQVCHWARKSSPLKNADENCSLGKKSKAAEVRLKSYLHDLDGDDVWICFLCRNFLGEIQVCSQQKKEDADSDAERLCDDEGSATPHHQPRLGLAES